MAHPQDYPNAQGRYKQTADPFSERRTKKVVQAEVMRLTGLKARDVTKIINVIFDVIARTLLEDRVFTLAQFGVFSITWRKACKTWHFTQKKHFIKPERCVLKFTPSKKFQRLVEALPVIKRPRGERTGGYKKYWDLRNPDHSLKNPPPTETTSPENQPTEITEQSPPIVEGGNEQQSQG